MLSLFWQITPHFEGIGAIKMVLGTFLKLRIVGNERSTSLFSYQLHMAVSCENGGFFGHHYWVQQFHEQYARAGQQA